MCYKSYLKSIYDNTIVSRTQMWTSAWKAAVLVAFMPGALTLRAVSLVAVYQATLETDLPADVVNKDSF